MIPTTYAPLDYNKVIVQPTGSVRICHMKAGRMQGFTLYSLECAN